MAARRKAVETCGEEDEMVKEGRGAVQYAWAETEVLP